MNSSVGALYSTNHPQKQMLTLGVQITFIDLPAFLRHTVLLLRATYPTGWEPID